MGKRIYNLGEGTQIDENAYIVVDKEGLSSAQKIKLSKLEELYDTNYIPLWKPNTEYKVGDIVKYIGEMDGVEDPIVLFLYCLKEHTSVNTFDIDEYGIWKKIYYFAAYGSGFANNIIAYIPTDNGQTTSIQITGKDIYDIMEALRDYYPAGRTIEETSCEIFNDYENNFASGDYTHSEGHQNVILHQMKLSQEEITYISYENGVLTVSAENNYFDNVDTQYFYIEHETNKVQVDMVKVSGMTKNGDNWSFNIEEPLSILQLPDVDDGKVKIYAIITQDEDGEYSHVEGWANISNGRAGHAEGWHNKVIDNYGHAEGVHTIAGYSSHAEGNSTTASGSTSHAEGSETVSSGPISHAEGIRTQSKAYHSHAEGEDTISSGQASHAEGRGTKAQGGYSHAEGSGAIAKGSYSHAEGYNTQANGTASHAEGHGPIANGERSHAEGDCTIADGYCQHVEGHYNKPDPDKAHIVGNGRSPAEKDRSNAYTLDWDGNGWYAGNIEASAIILRSSTSGSTKRFKITVDDTGTLKTEEIIDNL